MVVFKSLSKDKNVIQIDYYNLFYYEVLKNVIHHSLECNRTINHSKEYYQKFKKTMVSVKDSLLLISRLYVDIVETLAYIQHYEIFDILEFGHKFRD